MDSLLSLPLSFYTFFSCFITFFFFVLFVNKRKGTEVLVHDFVQTKLTTPVLVLSFLQVIYSLLEIYVSLRNDFGELSTQLLWLSEFLYQPLIQIFVFVLNFLFTLYLFMLFQSHLLHQHRFSYLSENEKKRAVYVHWVLSASLLLIFIFAKAVFSDGLREKISSTGITSEGLVVPVFLLAVFIICAGLAFWSIKQMRYIFHLKRKHRLIADRISTLKLLLIGILIAAEPMLGSAFQLLLLCGFIYAFVTGQELKTYSLTNLTRFRNRYSFYAAIYLLGLIGYLLFATLVLPNFDSETSILHSKSLVMLWLSTIIFFLIIAIIGKSRKQSAVALILVVVLDVILKCAFIFYPDFIFKDYVVADGLNKTSVTSLVLVATLTHFLFSSVAFITPNTKQIQIQLKTRQYLELFRRSYVRVKVIDLFIVSVALLMALLWSSNLTNYVEQRNNEIANELLLKYDEIKIQIIEQSSGVNEEMMEYAEKFYINQIEQRAALINKKENKSRSNLLTGVLLIGACTVFFVFRRQGFSVIRNVGFYTSYDLYKAYIHNLRLNKNTLKSTIYKIDISFVFVWAIALVCTIFSAYVAIPASSFDALREIVEYEFFIKFITDQA